MNRSTAKKGNVYVHPATINFYAEQTWLFAKSILWNQLPLSPEEIELSLHYIRQYYKALSPERFLSIAADQLTGYCERILLAKRYTDSHPFYTLPHPCIWLNPVNPKGFSGTKAWYENKRRSARKFKRH